MKGGVAEGTGADEPAGGEAGETGRYMVPGLERGLRLLGEFDRKESVLTGAELARRLGLPRSTVFRLLMTLESMGFVERTDEGGAWRLGLAVLRLGFEYLASQGLTELGSAIVEGIRDTTGRAAGLVVRDGREIVFVLRAVAASPFASSVNIGTRLPAHATVLGHVLLGDLSLAQLRALYPEPRLEAWGSGTPTTAAELFEVVQAVRQKGYGVSEGGFEAHISTVAAPIFDATSRIVAALGVTVPGPRIDAHERAALIGALGDGAMRLSGLLHDYTPMSLPAGSPQVRKSRGRPRAA